NGREVVVSLRKLGAKLAGLSAKPGSDREFDLPLVFMNACGSARLRADSAFSFPKLFLDNENRGFIGTEIEMPDDLAMAFSGAFYERFLRWGMPLGRAILESRRYLLYEHG